MVNPLFINCNIFFIQSVQKHSPSELWFSLTHVFILNSFRTVNAIVCIIYYTIHANVTTWVNSISYYLPGLGPRSFPVTRLTSP